MPKRFKIRGRGRYNAPRKYARARPRARDRTGESPPRGGRDYAAVRIKVAGRTIMIWNNSSEPITIEPGRALKLEIVERWVKELDYARVIGIEAEIVGEIEAEERHERKSESEYDVGTDSKDWL